MELTQAVGILDALLNEDWRRFNESVPVDYWLAVLPDQESIQVHCRLEALDTVAIRLEVSGKQQLDQTTDLKPLVNAYVAERLHHGQGPAALKEVRNLIALLNGLANQIEAEI
ncbi:MAG: hypothetical protein BWY87_00688 [Deltaproteobacteria bacterium ADurb.Bin510]|nr:MAG: hypothetical protein BWY87_00688 [Deltaproteobacteria bacterium ADurb.Bin510]